MKSIIEMWIEIDFVNWFHLPGKPLKLFQVSNLGRIRSTLDQKKYTLIPGTVRPGSNERPEYKYFSVRILGKPFKIPYAKCIIFAFMNIDDLNKYNITFINNDHKDCFLDNLKLDLKKCKHPVSDLTRKMYNNFAEDHRLYKIINYILSQKTIQHDVFYSKEDILQDYVMYLYDNLWQYESRSFSSFDTFCFFKAYDFISSLKFKLSKTPQCYYLSFLQSINDEKSSEKDYLESKACMTSEYSIRQSRYEYLIIESS